MTFYLIQGHEDDYPASLTGPFATEQDALDAYRVMLDEDPDTALGADEDLWERFCVDDSVTIGRWVTAPISQVTPCS
jgi:hypothetical protein